MKSEDVSKVYELSTQIHDLYESIDIFMERKTLCPEGCFVLGDCLGYAISHPYSLGSPPLNTRIHTLSKESDCWYLHDIAILPSYRKRGFVKSLLKEFTLLANKHSKRYLTLTSVNRTDSFWLRQGFEYYPGVQCPSYGESFFMRKTL
jgi:ribosomal protein S18 acetylase RimI-like enzyme